MTLPEPWTIDEILKVYQWLYPNEYYEKNPVKYEDCSEHFRKLLEATKYVMKGPDKPVVPKVIWMKLIKKKPKYSGHSGNQKYL